MKIIQRLLSIRLNFMKFTPWEVTHIAMNMLYPATVKRQIYLLPCSSTRPEEETLDNCALFNDAVISSS
jgi:hypothetical protein